MKISVKELLNLINIGHTKESFKNIVSNIVETLTKIGLEVESVVFEEDALANFVIAKVEECKKHPESEKLSICSVNNGIETFAFLKHKQEKHVAMLAKPKSWKIFCALL